MIMIHIHFRNLTCNLTMLHCLGKVHIIQFYTHRMHAWYTMNFQPTVGKYMDHICNRDFYMCDCCLSPSKIYAAISLPLPFVHSLIFPLPAKSWDKGAMRKTPSSQKVKSSPGKKGFPLNPSCLVMAFRKIKVGEEKNILPWYKCSIYIYTYRCFLINN